jgi:hypothetical protein
LGIRACQAGHRVAFVTAAQWVARLADAHQGGRIEGELVKLGRIPLLRSRLDAADVGSGSASRATQEPTCLDRTPARRRPGQEQEPLTARLLVDKG